jgi:hypothetical protein
MANPSLERLWHKQYDHISQQKIIVSHVISEIPCNNYTFNCLTSMVLLIHKESKSTNEFSKFCNELGEF